MARPITRVVSLLLAAQLASALAGCGSTTTGAQLAAAPLAGNKQAISAPVTSQATVALTPTVSTRAGAPAAVAQSVITPEAAPLTTDDSLFAHDYDPEAVSKYSAGQADSETASQVGKAYSAQGVGLSPGSSWGMIGAGIGAALLGATGLGYAIYTGTIGSHDLLYPAGRSSFAKDPGQYGWAYEPDWFETDNKLKLVAWYVPAEVPTTKAILVMHGHTSNKDTALKKYGAMLHHDYNLYLYDSRFHGGSEGKMTTLGYYERNDALLALQRMRDRGNTSIGIMGESMGAAVGIEAAAMDASVKSCWADCAFDSLHDAVAPRALKRKYPLPDFVATSVVEAASIRAKGRLATADPINWVAKIAPRPIYFIHGQADDDTTPINSDKLFDKAGQPKTIWRTAGAHHAESWTLFHDEYQTKIQAFFHASL